MGSMNREIKKISEDIKTNTFKQFYLFYGEEKYMILQMKDQLKRALISEDDTMNYSYFEGKKVDPTEIIELAKTVPFFNDHRFIILDGTGLGKKSDDLFIKGLKEISDTSVLLFIEDTIDKRSKIYKFLSKQGHAACFEPMKNKELSQWITLLLKKDEKQMSISTMNNFLYRCGSDMHTLKNELDKLISYVGDRKEITSYDLEQLTSSQTINQIFIMLDAIARKQRDKVLTLYYDLIELKESPFGILALLARQCNQLLQVKNLDDLGKDNGTISKEIKIPAFAVGKLKDQSKMFSIEVLLSMEALTIDEIISAKKNFLNIDKDLNLIHSVNETKETYYLIHCVAIITFLLLKQQALAESSAIMLLVVIYFLHRWKFHLSHMIIHNVLLFSHLFEKKYAYELLDKLNLCDQDYGKIRHVMSEFYKKEGM